MPFARLFLHQSHPRRTLSIVKSSKAARWAHLDTATGGVRPSPAAASQEFFGCAERSPARRASRAAAPEDGRTPLLFLCLTLVAVSRCAPLQDWAVHLVVMPQTTGPIRQEAGRARSFSIASFSAVNWAGFSIPASTQDKLAGRLAMSPRESPGRSSSLRVAGTGAMPMMVGATPARALPRSGQWQKNRPAWQTALAGGTCRGLVKLMAI